MLLLSPSLQASKLLVTNGLHNTFFPPHNQSPIKSYKKSRSPSCYVNVNKGQTWLRAPVATEDYEVIWRFRRRRNKFKNPFSSCFLNGRSRHSVWPGLKSSLSCNQGDGSEVNSVKQPCSYLSSPLPVWQVTPSCQWKGPERRTKTQPTLFAQMRWIILQMSRSD